MLKRIQSENQVPAISRKDSTIDKNATNLGVIQRNGSSPNDGRSPPISTVVLSPEIQAVYDLVKIVDDNVQKLTLDLANIRRELDTKPSMDDVRGYIDIAYLDLHQRLEALEHASSNLGATFEQMKHKREYACVDFQNYREGMQAVDWEIVQVAESVDEKMAILKDFTGWSLDSATDCKKRLAPKTFPRLDSKIKRLINRKSRKFKKWRKTGLISDNEEYRAEKFSSKFFKKDNKSN
ncbi:hypothetical protein QYM36_016960 [Artemia franciscana]|uniref:Uncharacterized protein n=1 Tax=Artemia franciscana TaxID=6661 RepID=A0AA88HG05_ARTSF|nr:hypothetical protein QYM36_016960 [Artemia franciscana]